MDTSLLLGPCHPEQLTGVVESPVSVKQEQLGLVSDTSSSEEEEEEEEEEESQQEMVVKVEFDASEDIARYGETDGDQHHHHHPQQQQQQQVGTLQPHSSKITGAEHHRHRRRQSLKHAALEAKVREKK
jgi:hypothetical protein